MSPSDDRSEDNDTTQNTFSQTPSTPARNLPPVPLFPNSSATTTSHVPDSMPASQNNSSSQTNDELPDILRRLLNGIVATLQSAFSERPPHTVQRLAELILDPKKHYATLPAWLRAVDRVVNVSSTADCFPLSDESPAINGVPNGETGVGILHNAGSATMIRHGYDSASLGSDESLGGALLTPIPWLRNGTNQSSEASSLEELSHREEQDNSLGGPLELSADPRSPTPVSVDDNSASAAVHTPDDPLVPERPDGAVTQGELIRMEQEAGVVPISAGSGKSGNAPQQNALDVEDIGETAPHARGPDLVGAVDMGKVGGKDVEVHIGSPPPDSEQALESSGGAVDKGQTGGSDTDGDYEMIDKESEVPTVGEEMEVDAATGQLKQAAPASDGSKSGESKDKDDDIVLVDLDGRAGDGTAVDASMDANK
jgi:hypothetical protein